MDHKNLVDGFKFSKSGIYKVLKASTFGEYI